MSLCWGWHCSMDICIAPELCLFLTAGSSPDDKAWKTSGSCRASSSPNCPKTGRGGCGKCVNHCTPQLLRMVAITCDGIVLCCEAMFAAMKPMQTTAKQVPYAYRCELVEVAALVNIAKSSLVCRHIPNTFQQAHMRTARLNEAWTCNTGGKLQIYSSRP